MGMGLVCMETEWGNGNMKVNVGRKLEWNGE